MAKNSPPPEVTSLFPAMHVQQDPVSGYYTVFSIITNVRPKAYPYQLPVLFVYFELVNGRGNVKIQIRVIDVDEARPSVFDVSPILKFPSPLHVLQGAFHKRGPIFPAPGQYRVQLLYDDQVLRERKMWLQEPKQASNEKTPDE